MSKSAANPNSRILLSDSTDEIALKIRKAVTDSDTHITYDPIKRPGVSNLLRILLACRRLTAAERAPQIASILQSHSSKSSLSPDLARQDSVVGTDGQSGTPGPTPPPIYSYSQSDSKGSSTPSQTIDPPRGGSDSLDFYHTELSELAASFQGVRTPQFKEAVVHAVDACLDPIRAELQKFRADEGYVRQVAREGADRARAIASQTMREVKIHIGLD